ncbi:heparin lyase I family protein [Paraburkholderia bannensis]|uniref:heparin lyase I family protein n=1 Tax=Paraburkholderia bannensis TaxID=765414 RepID=UPI002AB1906B|nr:heparin lyase I family protein [Paraburkholderia bannensis]
MVVQKASLDDVAIVDDPIIHNRKALRFRISRDEDFSSVANGYPRAEVSFSSPLRFETASRYVVKWQSFIPVSFTPDSRQSVVIMQIHQGGCCSGPPPIMLTIRGERYEFAERSSRISVRERQISPTTDDIEKWVSWTLEYTPDPGGTFARTVLLKDGVEVYSSFGLANAYDDSQSSYLKIGLYKAGWKTESSGPDRIEILLGDMSICQETMPAKEVRSATSRR